MRFYIASRLENDTQVREVAEALTAAGHTQTYDWTAHGSVQKEHPDRIREVAMREKRGVLEADRVIVILPGGKGTHTELGMAIAAGKEITICAEEPQTLLHDTCSFYWDERCEWIVGTQERWIEDIMMAEVERPLDDGR